jgi:ATPase subunit of ABC transporter with duplicated ATPase domains
VTIKSIVEEMQGRSVLDEAIAGSGRVGDLHHELEALQREMSDPDKADDMDRILDRFGHVQEEYEHLGGYALESQAREVLHGPGFKDDQIDGDVGALSGGWKMRVALARVLLGMPDVLLMDEPTNHLDIESIDQGSGAGNRSLAVEGSIAPLRANVWFVVPKARPTPGHAR